MSNLKKPLLRHDFFPDNPILNQALKKALDDLYDNGAFRDREVEFIPPSKESMEDGEDKVVDISGTVRHYFRRGNNIYYSDLTKV